MNAIIKKLLKISMIKTTPWKPNKPKVIENILKKDHTKPKT